jgi:hypothetical protein
METVPQAIRDLDIARGVVRDDGAEPVALANAAVGEDARRAVRSGFVLARAVGVAVVSFISDPLAAPKATYRRPLISNTN